MNVKVVGVGGIGTHVIDPVARLLESQPDGPHLLALLDGDKVEQKNLARQSFSQSDIGAGKAEIAAVGLRQRFSDDRIQIGFDTVYLDKENVKDYI
ncbi:MAG: ThiF family adenylyltransferase, partial [Candidatus Thorarchaeota archaeon]